MRRLDRWLPDSIEITLLADRGFGYAELYEQLGDQGWDYVIRFRENIIVAGPDDDAVAASELVPAHGRARKIVEAKVTRTRNPVPAVVLVNRKGMKESWCLATSLATADANEIVKAYSRRFTIEETFRDTTDIAEDQHVAQADHIALQPGPVLVPVPRRHARRLARRSPAPERGSPRGLTTFCWGGRTSCWGARDLCWGERRPCWGGLPRCRLAMLLARGKRRRATGRRPRLAGVHVEGAHFPMPGAACGIGRAHFPMPRAPRGVAGAEFRTAQAPPSSTRGTRQARF